MDRAKFRIRPTGPEDYEALSRLRSRTLPERPTTPDEERHWDHVADASHLTNERWLVEERASGKAVATSTLNQSPYSYDPHKFWVEVRVDPDFTHLGIGRALVSLLDAEASEHRANCLWASVRKRDARAKKFAESAGFAELRTLWMSELDLSQPTAEGIEDRTADLEHQGIRFTTLAAEGPGALEVRRRLYDLWNEASRDVPRMGEYTSIPFESFTAELESPTVIPEAFFLACSGDVYVGESHLDRDLAQPDSLLIGFTGTRAAFRGRGIATELKRRSVEYGKEHGHRYLRTFNDSLNAPIWAINEKMGFRRTLELSQLERRFSPAGNGVPPETHR